MHYLLKSIRGAAARKAADPGFFTVAASAQAPSVGPDELAKRSCQQGGDAPMRWGVVSVGYEGRTAERLVTGLRDLDVKHLVDVRLTPLSRKPGLSKRKLATALLEAGITYRHMPSLGNPAANRAAFRDGHRDALATFRALLREEGPLADLNEVLDLAVHDVVAVLCVEQEEVRCHRRLILEWLADARKGLPVARLPAPT